MRKFFLIISLLPILVFPFKDLPKNHWAYEEVTALAKLGIVSGYPDGTFRGNENVTRYQLAVAIYRTIVYVKDLIKSQMRVPYSYEKRLQEISDVSSKAYKWSSENSKVISQIKAEIEELKRKIEDTEDVKLLYNEVVSLKTEILEKMMKLDREYRQRISSIEERLESLEKRPVSQTKVVKEECDLSWVEGALETLKASMSEIAEAFSREMSSLKREAIGWKPAVKSLKSQMEDLKEKITLVESSVSKIPEILQEDLRGFDKDIGNLTIRIENVENEMKGYALLKSKVEELSRKFEIFSKDLVDVKRSFESSFTAVEGRIGKLEREIEELLTVEKDLRGVETEIEKLRGELKDLKKKTRDVEVKIDASLNKLEERMEDLEGGFGETYNELKDYVNEKFSECPSDVLVKVALVFSVVSTIISAIVLFISF